MNIKLRTQLWLALLLQHLIYENTCHYNFNWVHFSLIRG